MSKKNVNKNKFLAGAITATMVASAVAPIAALADETEIDFSDVDKNSSHYNNIVKAAERGLMTGYQGEFNPLGDMTRGQVVKALGKYLVGQEGLSLDKYIEQHDLLNQVTPFHDVPADSADQELFKYSLVVKDAEAFTGDRGNLKAANNIKREQMSKVLVEAFNLQEVEGKEANVADMADVQDQYANYVTILSQHEITKADDNKYRPKGNVTRQQMASFLNRSFDVVHEDEGVELVVESVTAIDATTISVVFEGVEEAVEITLDTELVDGENQVTFTYNEQEFTEIVNYETPVTGLVVESVETNNATKVVTVKASVPEIEEESAATVTIFTYDEDGERAETAEVTVEAVEIVDEAIEVEIDAVETGLESGDYVAVVTNGEAEAELDFTLDYEAVDEIVEKVKVANKANLALLLADKEYFTGYKVANVDVYHAKVASEAAKLNTIDDIQKLVIDAANTKVEMESNFAEFKEVVEETSSEFAKYTLLKEYFQYVNDENMDAYMNASNGIFTGSLTVAATDAESVQNAIDTINLKAVSTKIGTLNNTVKPSKLADTQSLLNELQLVNDEVKDTGNQTKQDLLDQVIVLEESLAQAVEAAEIAVAKANEALSAYKVATGENFNVETAVYKNLVDKLAELNEEDLSESVIEAKVTELGNGVDDNQLIHTLVAKTDELVADGQVANFLKANADVINISLTPDAENQVEYTDLPEIKVALDTFDKLNRVAQEKLNNVSESDLLVDGITVKAKLDTLEVSAKSRYLIDVNLAGATPMVGLLEFLGNAQYAKLDADQQREVAELFILDESDGRPANGFDAELSGDNAKTVDEVTAAFDQTIVIKVAKTVSNYTQILKAINSATTYSEMEVAIEKLATLYGITEVEKSLLSIILLDEKPDEGYATFAEIFELAK